MPARSDVPKETHRSQHAAWLRAAILGANDGTVSTAALMVGVAAADASSGAALTAGLAGLIGGALSMATGEYVSVSGQLDAERADLEKERAELESFPEAELRELTEIYVKRGLERDLAHDVALQLTAHDPLAAHLRDELNLSPDEFARPVQASVVSATSFAVGAAIPLVTALIVTGSARVPTIALVALFALGLLGFLGARLGGAAGRRAALRVLLGGVVAMGLTALIGRWVGPIG